MLIDQHKSKIVIATFFLTSMCWGAFIAVVLSSIAPYNSTSYKVLDKREAIILRSFLPEGFGFFTRDPQEEFPVIFKEENDTLVLLTKPNSSISNFFGLKRNQRTIFAELGLIVQEIPTDDWSRCSTSLSKCLTSTTYKTFEIRNKKNKPNLCGTYFVCTINPVPWAWRNSFKGSGIPQRFIRLVIFCDNEDS